MLVAAPFVVCSLSLCALKEETRLLPARQSYDMVSHEYVGESWGARVREHFAVG